MLNKKLSSAIATTTLMLSASFASVSFADSDLKTVTDRVSYIFGFQIGQRFKQDQVDVNIDAFAQAMKDIAAGKEPALTEEEMSSAMRALQDMQQAKHNESMKIVGAANLKEGKAFLAENAKKDGVVTTKSGLQYTILTKGTGPKPVAGNKVKVHYAGSLLDGVEFDSSYRRDIPAEFGVTQVIPGWTEALQLMPEGSKWKLFIPADLAYGAGGTTDGKIGPNAVLIFDVELLTADQKPVRAD
jgi:FKBP-type peptidyl-prolyl cis-trans isomerase